MLGIQGFRAAHSPALTGESWLSPEAALMLAIAGAIILVGGFALFLTAQWQMGASWRIGIDENAKPGLVVSGLFRLTRNPIYLVPPIGSPCTASGEFDQGLQIDKAVLESIGLLI